MSCDSCNSSPAAQERERETKTKEAFTYAQENKTTVFLYKDPLEGWQFCTESGASGKPIACIIPYIG